MGKLFSLGHKIIHVPTLKISSTDLKPINPDKYDAFIFTSANAIRSLKLVKEDKNKLCFCVGMITEKIVRQKGSGGARHGDKKVSQYRGGGVAHGPRVRSHAHKLPRKVRNMAMRCALSSKLKEGNIVVLNDISFSSMKTKLLQKSLNKLPIGKSALFIAGEELDQNFNKAIKNIPMHDLLPIQGANVYDILRRETLVLSKSSVEALVARLANKKEKAKIKKEKK